MFSLLPVSLSLTQEIVGWNTIFDNLFLQFLSNFYRISFGKTRTTAIKMVGNITTDQRWSPEPPSKREKSRLTDEVYFALDLNLFFSFVLLF